MSHTIKNDIKLRQVALVFLALMPVTKVLMLPSIVADFVGEQIWLPITLNLLFDALVVFLILKLGERYPNLTFYEIAEKNLGKVASKILFFFIGAFFFLKSLVPILEQKHFIDNTLYEVFPNFISFFPLMFLSAYACLKGLKVLGRCVDICVFFTVIGLLVIIYFSVSTCDITNLFPIFQKPHYNTVNAMFSSVIWFTEGAYMLLFLGKFNNEKNGTIKIMSCFLIGSVFVVAIAVIFYGIFGPIANTQVFAVSDMTIYTTKIINIGRFDYLAIFMLLFSKIFAVCLPAYTATKFFEKCFSLDKALIPALIVNGLLLVAIFVFKDKFLAVLDFSNKYLNWYFVLMGYLMPIVFYLVLRRRKSEKV